MKIPENIKAVIFDVDGLIVDSEPTWEISHNEFFEKNKISVDEKYKETFRGIGLKELILQIKENFHLEKSVDELLSEYRKIFYKNFLNSKEAKLIEGVEECVKSFYEKNYQLAIATGGHTFEEMQKMLETFNLLKYFPVIISSDEVHRGKPNPDVFLLTAKRLGREPFECLVLEDSVNGVVAARTAKMTVWGINKDPKIYSDLKKAGADEVFKDIDKTIN